MALGDLDGNGTLDAFVTNEGQANKVWLNVAPVDFGDAPEPYPTTLAENGARHAATSPTEPRLGIARDGEADGTHSADANADDTTDTADEEGVVIDTILVGTLSETVTVNVQGAVGKLDAWIDFNGDGSWGGPTERIAESLAVGIGNNIVTFDVPSWAAAGDTYARFRLSTAGGLAVDGPAADGEVEDYKVTISSPALGSGEFSSQRIISTGADGANSVFAADVDGDGDMDVLSASYDDNTIAWYESDGTGDPIFTAHDITTTANGASSVFAADVDGDGDIDVLSASSTDNTIAWYENDGNENFTQHTITSTATGASSVYAADVDGDGDLDVLSASFQDHRIAWYENDGSENFTTHTIATNIIGAGSVFAADMDGDGDLDVLSASGQDSRVIWYENDGSQNFTLNEISTAADRPVSVFAADVNSDGHLDVVSAAFEGDKVAWYENDGAMDPSFTARTITTTADSAQSVFAADVDGDGDTDVLSASANDDKIAWYENDGSENFTTHTVNTADPDSDPGNGTNGDADGAASVFAADVDGDGDLDILSASGNDDKIAWYRQPTDFGDAPAPYPTTSAEDGARHGAIGLTLGSTRDDEGDGTHSANADADDTTGLPDDEDGVMFGTLQVGALGATATVNVQGAAGKLDAWIDFNGDGSWGGPGEQIADSLMVNIDNNIVMFDVPSWAEAGDTYARFRLSTAGGLGVGGSAADGEVEDYQVTIDSPATGSGLFDPQISISTAANGANSVFAADVDSDGDVDVLSASNSDVIAWYENDGAANPTFTAHTISTMADQAISVFAADIDGDGDVDVLSASYRDDKIAWYENDGSENFTERTISTGADQATSVFAADVDGDGDIDVLSSSLADGEITWYENDGAAVPTFTTHVISTAIAGANSVFAADVDNDGDLDVLGAFHGDAIAWYENDGASNPNFTLRTISTAIDQGRSVFAADVDDDGDLDVISASALDDKIAWYENDGASDPTFTAHTITTDADAANSVFAADIDGDGDIDVVSASNSDVIAWYENDGAANPTFTAHTISTAADNAKVVFAADVDGDGDLDVLSASRNDNKIAWYKQLPPPLDFGDAPDVTGGPVSGNPYPTLLEHNGARHAISGPHLGASIDDEAEGQPNATATGDDTDGTDDEDGVVFTSMLIPGQMATVDVTTTGAGLLNAWVDFSGNGSFTDLGDQIFTDFSLGPGLNAGLTFPVPFVTPTAQTFARFRFDQGGGLSFDGLAPDGEVEDYEVAISGCSTSVTNTADSGAGTLRDAILCSEFTPGVQTIDFNIPGAGTHAIAPLSPLPAVTDPAIIDGTTEPDFAGTPVVELDGSSAGAGANGLRLLAGSSTVRGLIINRFAGSGVRIETGDGNVISGNFIGTGAGGTVDQGNSEHGIFILNSSNNTIGGATAAASNLISGNDFHGISLVQTTGTTSGNMIRGNRIGTDVAGTAALGNGIHGVRLSAVAGNTIGGTAAGAENLISGNTQSGIKLEAGANSNTVQGNAIGLDISLSLDRGNMQHGVFIVDSSNNTIGGTAAGAGNAISGNDLNGVSITQITGTSTGNMVQGNTIGTNAAGNAAVGNSYHGVRIGGASGNTIGGTAADAGNLISGNSESGVKLEDNANSNAVQDNFIGTDINGTTDLGNLKEGVFIEDSSSNMIGGTTAAAGNLISGNDRDGIFIQKSAGGTANGNLVQGNEIGTNDGGTSALPNGRSGVILQNTSNTSVGGAVAGAGNVIAHNVNRGVQVVGNAATGNTIRRNSMFGNGTPGIDLGGDGNTANDANDPDAGPNALQNFPLITSVVVVGETLQITYSVPSTSANSAFPLTLEFFLSDGTPRHGKEFLGSQSYTEGTAPTVTFLRANAVLGSPIVATATDDNGNTSEFSSASSVVLPLQATGQPARPADASAINFDNVLPVVDAAISIWRNAGLTAEQVNRLRSVDVQISDLPGKLLGVASNNTIVIDTGAAGFGWFVDQTPLDDSEFTTADADALDQMDLLTAVLHEFGHILELADVLVGHDDDLMSAWLEVGTRRKPN